MTQQDKELLLKDLCARLPYGVQCKVHYIINNETTDGEDVDAEETDTITKVDTTHSQVYTDWLDDWSDVEDIKPYLRPMSSMTEEEKSKLNGIIFDMGDKWFADESSNQDKWKACCLAYGECADYLNSIHIDYRGLIEKGLALEAPEGMYKFE